MVASARESALRLTRFRSKARRCGETFRASWTDAVLGTFRMAAMACAAVCGVTAAQADAGQATFVSGEAANAALSAYRNLAASHTIPSLGTSTSSPSLRIDESTDAFAIRFLTPGTSERSIASDAPAGISVVRSSTSRASFSGLEAGTKVLRPSQTSAFLNALDFEDKHPAASDAVRRNSAAGKYIAEVFEPGAQYIFVGLSYPSSFPAGTSIGCNPQREFRYDTVSNVTTEVHPPC